MAVHQMPSGILIALIVAPLCVATISCSAAGDMDLGSDDVDQESGAVKPACNKKNPCPPAQDDLSTGGDAPNHPGGFTIPGGFGVAPGTLTGNGALPAGDSSDCFAVDVPEGHSLVAALTIETADAGSSFWGQAYDPTGFPAQGGTAWPAGYGPLQVAGAQVGGSECNQSTACRPPGVYTVCIGKGTSIGVPSDVGAGTYELIIDIEPL